jgi:hypothetical protein
VIEAIDEKLIKSLIASTQVFKITIVNTKHPKVLERSLYTQLKPELENDKFIV